MASKRTKEQARKKCLTCSCAPYARGLCRGCFTQAIASIKSGEIAEQTAIDRGMILPSKKRGPKPKNGFAKALAKLVKS